jgi:hypothetical protein
MSTALAKLQLRMREARVGSEEARKIFKDLGVEFKDAQGNLRPVTDLFLDIADKIQRTGNDAERTGIIMKVFEEEGRRLGPMLAAGSAGIEGMLRQFRGLGGGISRDAIQRSVEMTDAFTQMKVAGLSLTSVLATSFLPKMIETINWLTRVASWIREVTENSHILRATAITLGAALAAVGVMTVAAWGPAALTVGLVTAAIVLAALAIDDLWVTVEGGDSVLRDFIDNMLGVGATTQIVNNARQAWEDLAMVLNTVNDALREYLQMAPARYITRAIRYFETLGEEAPELTEEQRAALPRAREALRATQARGRAEQRAIEFELFGLAPTPEERARIPQTIMPTTEERILEQTIAPIQQRRRLTPLQQQLELSLLPAGQRPVITPIEAAPQVTQNIGDASTTVNVTVEGGGDPEQAARAFRRVAREEAESSRDLMLRQLEESLAPVGAR